jgi:four helix bundle protein
MKKKIAKFEDLIAWQKARKLTTATYQATNRGAFSRDFELRNQIRRAAISIMSNLAEGFERGGPAEFHRFITIAKGSCAEWRSQLYVAADVGYLDSKAFGLLMSQGDEVAKIIGGLRIAVAQQRAKGV